MLRSWLHMAVLALPLALVGCVDDEGSEETSGAEAPEGLGDDLTALVSYRVTASGELTGRTLHEVPDELADAQGDEEVHAAIWATARVIFESHLEWVGAFVIFTDGPDETLAQVYGLPNDPTTWALAIDQEDALDENGEVGGDALTATLVHELAHIVGLNADQVELDAALAADPENADLFAAGQAACDTLFLDEGCALADAYILAFHEAFWVDLADYTAQLEAIEDDAERDEVIAAKYEEAPERFVSEYAATDLAEDFAESFAVFALQPLPSAGLERDDKVLFFNTFPELVALRNAFLEGGFGVQAGSLTARGLGQRCR